MKPIKIIATILGICVSVPISIYLQWYLLKQVNASELAWFLFWANIPVLILCQLILKLVSDDKKSES